jgi:hypothetical protein
MVLDTCTEILNGDTGTCTQLGITKEWCNTQLQTTIKWTSLRHNEWDQCEQDKWAGGRELKLLAYPLSDSQIPGIPGIEFLFSVHVRRSLTRPTLTYPGAMVSHMDLL